MKIIKSYEDFLNEAKDDKIKKSSKLNIVLLSNISDESYTVPALKKECESRGISFAVVDINACTLSEQKDKTGFILEDKHKTKVKIDSEKTVILTRRGVVKNTYTRDLVSKLEDANFFVVNTLDSILACENKFTTYSLFVKKGIETPRTAIIDGEDSIDKAVEFIGGEFPLILKMLSGSHGIGVSIIDSLASLKSVLQTLWKVDPSIETLVQEKIESDHDLRIHVLSKKFNSPKPTEDDAVILGQMRRNKIKKDFRTNYSLGGTVDKVEITEEQKNLAIRAARAVGCNWCGVDIIVDKKSKKNYVLEVNSSPGTQGLKKATGIDVVKDVIDFVLDKENWTRSKRTIGYREVITIEGIGDIVAKFDTGNGALSSSLTYDKMKISEDGKTVTWSLGKNEFTHKIKGTSNAEVGNDVHERPIIEIDIIFMGKKYENVRVSLADRKDKSTKFLANRQFMERLGVSVAPNKTFMLTEFDGEYSAKDTKGDNHLGIKFIQK